MPSSHEGRQRHAERRGGAAVQIGLPRRAVVLAGVGPPDGCGAGALDGTAPAAVVAGELLALTAAWP